MDQITKQQCDNCAESKGRGMIFDLFSEDAAKTYYRICGKVIHKAYNEGIEIELRSYVPTLWVALGEPLYFSLDTPKNMLHATYKEDVEIFEAVLRSEKRI